MFSYKRILNDNDTGREIKPEELEELKRTLLVMYEEIRAACNKHGMHIYSSNGTTLGAVRHSGFIPWDDDLDLALLREDYNRFGKVYEEELKDRYVISAPIDRYKAHNRFIQLYRKDTLLKTKLSNGYEPDNIYIDIFPVDFVPDNFLKRLIKGITCNLLMAIGGCVSMVEYNGPELKRMMEKSVVGNVQYHLMLMFGSIFSYKSADKWFHRINRFAENKASKRCGILLGRVHYFGEIINSKSWLMSKEVDFENTTILIPYGTNEYLTALYGDDYMQLPPEEKRESHHIVELKGL